jgi:hypothetical protein
MVRCHPNPYRRCIALAVFLAPVLGWSLAPGQAKKPAPNNAPQVIMSIPLGAPPGRTTRITIRGLRLHQASALRFPNSKATAKIVSKGRATVPNKVPAKEGETQVVADVTLPKETTGPTVNFVVVTPAGASKAHPLLVEKSIPVVAEKEPNNGFRTAQKIQFPQAVDGVIAHAKDVDVFRFEGKAGQKVVCEVLAARYGSALDSLLTLYDADGQELASNDDIKGSTDSRLEITLPKTAAYFLSLMDAHDQGGPAHVYRLVVRPGGMAKGGKG